MPATISIPRAYMGETLQEAEVKIGLRELQPELHFDMGVALNIWHPYQECRQNVFYRGRSIGAMDRGTLPEVPIWSTRKDLIEIPADQVRPGELCLYRTAGCISTCLKCGHTHEWPERPMRPIFCLALCGNSGASTDTTRFRWDNKQTGTAFVYRTEKDRIILVGWRHTFWRLLWGQVPGITQRKLELRFRINLEEKPLHEIEVAEDVGDKMLSRGLEVA